MTTVNELLTDLMAEHDALDAVLAPLAEPAWASPTPAEGWTVADQVAHLTYFDRTAALAIADPEGFVVDRDALLQQVMSGAADMDDVTIGDLRALAPDELLTAWREGRAGLVTAASGLSESDRVEWYGPSMSARSFLTARLMETWAHGQDVVDGLVRAGLSPAWPATDRLRHIAQLGVITRGWSYAVRGAEVPGVDVTVVLAAPGGDEWRWGDPGTGSAGAGANSVQGPAEDFCLVVTQRRHVDDTALVVQGDAARDWMLCAQAFAGGATQGPAAGTFA